MMVIKENGGEFKKLKKNVGIFFFLFVKEFFFINSKVTLKHVKIGEKIQWKN